jgi:hypothetical protein
LTATYSISSCWQANIWKANIWLKKWFGSVNDIKPLILLVFLVFGGDIKHPNGLQAPKYVESGFRKNLLNLPHKPVKWTP